MTNYCSREANTDENLRIIRNLSNGEFIVVKVININLSVMQWHFYVE